MCIHIHFQGGKKMNKKLIRVGTTYIPVSNPRRSAQWYIEKLGAELNYEDEDKAILQLANHSVFLVKAQEGQFANFIDVHGKERFSLTFEIDGMAALKSLHQEFTLKKMRVGEIEDRGHAGRNFVFKDIDGNQFDVWSELSPAFKTSKQN